MTEPATNNWDEPRGIAVVFGSRADAGLLAPVFQSLKKDPQFNVLSMAINGDDKLLESLSIHGLRPDILIGFDPSAHIDNEKLSSAKALGDVVAKAAIALETLDPDLVILLGDRYEIFAVASAATALTIPIAHLCGGDVTRGANDDAYRHAISKMSHIHFPSNQDAARRLICMGERPNHIHVIGNPSLDHMFNQVPLPKDDFFSSVGLLPKDKNILITYHSETLDNTSSIKQITPLLGAVSEMGQDIGVIITAANLDAGGNEINQIIEEFSIANRNVVFYPNLGAKLYHSAMVHMDCMVGNSSSGLYEAPSFKCATVNIGGRQEGRLKAASVFDAKNETSAITGAINKALDYEFTNTQNPYGDGRAVERLLHILKSMENPKRLLKKGFYEGEGHEL